VENVLTIAAGAVLDLGSYSLSQTRSTVNDANWEVTGAGTLEGGSGTVSLAGDIDVAGYVATSGITLVGGTWNVSSFTPGTGTVRFTYQGMLGSAATDWTFNNLTIAGGAFLDTDGRGLVVLAQFENQGILWRYGTATEQVSRTDTDSGTVIYYNGIVQEFPRR
jgi:hypothetical protein